MAVDDQYTTSLMHFDGNLNDESGKTWTAYGGATTSASAAKFGSGGLYCPAASAGYLQGPSLTLGGQDFCIEGFAALGNVAVNNVRVFDFGDGEASNNIVLLRAAQTTYVYIALYDSGSIVWQSTHVSFSYDTMFHYALSYEHSSGTWRFFFNGALISSAVHAFSRRVLTKCYYAKSNWAADGYAELKLDEARVSDGNARYTANFTPPTAPFGSTTSIYLPQPILFF